LTDKKALGSSLLALAKKAVMDHPIADAEGIERSAQYTLNRILDGHVQTENETKAVFAAFNDGFKTGRES
jgi:hypothetical protein